MTTYGIDLGTTYSAIAYVDDAGRPVIVKNAIGEDTTASVVYFESPDNVVVGRDAKNSARIDPEHVISLIKRQVGKRVEFTFHGTTHTPETISALILTEVARAAGEHTGEPVRDVVITVPAYFGVAEREATRNAGRIAGLNVLNVLAEPVAAALHYDALAGTGERTILVYDLGGGTFDTTVINLSGDDVRVVCTGGDHQLGGADWDDRIVSYLLGEFVAANPELDEDPAASEDFLQELAIAAEDLKKGLSSVESRRYGMRFGAASARVELTRQKFEELTSELLDRTVEITAQTVELARSKGADRFDDVLLVGGATRMPAVRAALAERFGFTPKLHDPDLAVAKGAAQFALIESVKVALPAENGAVSERAAEAVANQLGLTTERVRDLANKRVATVTPRAFGIRCLDGEDPSGQRSMVAHLLHANTALPVTLPAEAFYTVDPNQTDVEISVQEQAGAVESAELADNVEIGTGLITGLPNLPASAPIEVTFSMDETGTLRVRAVEPTSGRDVRIELAIRGMDESGVERARAELTRYRVGE